ncbi:hypothetical protein CABS01_11601 [Colletotrichum abscissum]|uniref:Cytochrome P450 n=6 Tax=Colletotrichum acutatum species complex TaxID=2707335 RepID=A0A010SJY6_9PEZI|nr:uncharacterized protein COL516b_001816 [Colletotrichum fioriniae]XP_060313311.1 uncharacterized protein CCOS01_07252 [Colletotrichum costaricense]XP_060374433.1 uncharacterized protein CTAM01_14960 [Colletotrichum tamarilloi]XP_060397371.1 uncharacterized protein CABS01_11601 [Colletotrichum abscissum]EXF85183.1 hypothetical protein CFIO01_03254 [Colletotrichum fioriniae PJ7]KAK0373365.1 hypothetical protein CLIM01_09296 [Colletotrichum limetticola]KAK1465074.1 hypothetical protein CMEL01_
MQHIGSLLLAFATLTAAVPGLAPASVRSAKSSHVRRADTSSFQIYAYGTGIGGLALFTAGGDAYFGDYTQFNDSNAAPVIFTPEEDDTETWLGAPNTTAVTTAPTWSNLTFTIPTADSGVHNVAFLNSSASTTGRKTSGFSFYGNFVLVEAEDGSFESWWYATATDIDGIYNLRWNETGDDTDDKIILNLRRTAPSN